MRGRARRPQIIAFISSFYERNGYYPTVREIAKGIGLASTSSVHDYLCDLVDEGHLRRLQVTTDRFVFALPEEP